MTDLIRQYCGCGQEMRLMPVVDSSEWGSSWWTPQDPSPHHPHHPHHPDLPAVPPAAEPTRIAVGRHRAYRVYVCPCDVSHRHRTVVS